MSDKTPYIWCREVDFAISKFLLLIPPQPQFDIDLHRQLLGSLHRLPPHFHRLRQRPRHPQRHAGRGASQK